MNTCERSEAVRDYAFDELSGAERVAAERHIEGCAECAAELRSMRLTTAALRSVPDREIPQRIAFVSDKLFEPSPWVRFWRGFFGSPMQVGFASACLLAGAISFSAMRKPVEIRTVVAGTAATADISAQIDAAVKKAVAQVQEEDRNLTQVTLAAAEEKHRKEHDALLASMRETVDVMQRRMGAYTSELASLERPFVGGGQ